jgi:pimeloyl-ACP methyl ester carboxylesterase
MRLFSILLSIVGLSIVSLSIVGLSIVSLSGCNAIHFNHFLLRQRFARAGLEEFRIRLRSGEIRYFAGGEGPPLLLLHGFGFGAVENWAKQGPAFAQHRRVIAPDLYWFGASVPSSPIESAAAEAEAMVELLDALHIQRADLVGASFGGLIAVHMAMRHPDRVDRLVLVDAAGLRPTRQEQLNIAANFGGRSHVEELLMPTELEQLKTFLERVVYRHKPPFPDWVLRQVMHELGRNREAKTRLCRALNDELFDEASLSQLAARTLVIWGRNDPLLLVSMGERMAHSIPGAELLIFDNSAHSAMLEQPWRFNEAVLRFLDGPSTAPGTLAAGGAARTTGP